MGIVYELLKEEVEKAINGEKTYMDKTTLKLQIEFFLTAKSIEPSERDELIAMFPIEEVLPETPVI